MGGGSQDRVGQRQRARERRRGIVLTLKNKPCLDCGQKRRVFCMGFYHRNPVSRKGKISQMSSTKQILEEAAKCDVLCNRCGAKRKARASMKRRLQPALFDKE